MKKRILVSSIIFIVLSVSSLISFSSLGDYLPNRTLVIPFAIISLIPLTPALITDVYLCPAKPGYDDVGCSTPVGHIILFLFITLYSSIPFWIPIFKSKSTN